MKAVVARGGRESHILYFTIIWDVAGGGLFLRWPLAITLIVSIQNVHVARNWYEYLIQEKLSKPLIPLYTKIYREAIIENNVLGEKIQNFG
jgi:hypothetical protein